MNPASAPSPFPDQPVDTSGAIPQNWAVLVGGNDRRLYVMPKKLIAGTAVAAGLLLLATPAEAAKIVFTATNAPLFTVPSGSSPTSSQISVTSPLSTTGGTNLFDGATGWINAGGNPDTQNVAWQLSSDPGANGERDVNLRFNQFSLSGTCAICGVTLAISSNGYQLGNIYPGSARAFNTGAPGSNASILRAGIAYGLPAITFDVPNLPGQVGNVSFELNSGGTYTITVEAPDAVPTPLPLLGGASAFAFSRRLRRRIKSANPA